MAERKRIYEGKPCKRCHGTTRRGGHCIKCERLRVRNGPKRREPLHPLYGVWQDIKKRCYNPKCRSYPDWGGRGIGICDQWRVSFSAFVADAPPLPEGPPGFWSIHRINNHGNYEPGNIAWATPTEQNRNKRNVKLTIERAREIRALHAQGARQADLAQQFGVARRTISDVLRNKLWNDD